MEIDIRRAAQEDLDAAEQLYNDVCSALEAGTNWPGWRQGVYPTRTDARRAQAAGVLYLAWDGARAIGSMVLNHDADPDYAQVPGWGPDADWPHLLLIHTLAVHPAYQGRGLAGGCSPMRRSLRGKAACVRFAWMSVWATSPAHPPV